MPVSVGTTFKLHYKITENSKLRADIEYNIVEMTDNTFTTPKLNPNGTPATPCIQMLDDGQVLANSTGFAQVTITSSNVSDVNAVCNVTVLPKLERIDLSVNSITLLSK